jgi:hypothetical protein
MPPKPLLVALALLARLAGRGPEPCDAGLHHCATETQKDFCLSYGECQWNWGGYCDPPSAPSTGDPPSNSSSSCSPSQHLVEVDVPGCQFCENVALDQKCRVRWRGGSEPVGNGLAASEVVVCR